jgi:hypothetical protein
MRGVAMTILRIALAAVAVAVGVGMSASAGAAADGSAFMLAGTPKLYAVGGHDRLGQPVAYVTLRGDRHLHDPRLRAGCWRVRSHVRVAVAQELGDATALLIRPAAGVRWSGSVYRSDVEASEVRCDSGAVPQR